MKKILKTTLMGIGISSSIMLMFIVIYDIHMGFQDVFGVYLFGAICGFLPFVYDIERIPLPVKLLIHFGGSIFGFFIISSINHWVPFKSEALIGALVIFTLIFLIIWVIFFIIVMQQSKKINTKLKSTQK
ncbi:DUF3021 domain-containing protein [Staphylococcus americanisciuri]|uniref:DUF3021 domain-containing protein n=1 Tax=Staphylococcus americanisciuri TaxID=2973940 RepID=A0ABT2F0B5_9STAP|nr:DUF3021 domain-containing protein [Staphylococcus americanisciuri]MCS4485870.1 DUF3021 domain-containing protein [Staphylococcus americanisciuri]